MSNETEPQMTSRLFDAELRVLDREQSIAPFQPYETRHIDCLLTLRRLQTTEHYTLPCTRAIIRVVEKGNSNEKPWGGIIFFRRGEDSFESNEKDRFFAHFYLSQDDFDGLWSALQGFQAPTLTICCEARVEPVKNDEFPIWGYEPPWNVEKLDEAELPFRISRIKINSRELVLPESD